MSGEDYERAIALLRQSRRAVALTGAGISTPSGIADFRTPDTGLWSRVDPMEAASIYSFLRNPAIFYNWFSETSVQMFGAEPNPAHLALAEMEERGVLRAVVTQNIDGLHRKAGSRYVLELHGNCRTATCIQCGEKAEGLPLLEQFVQDGQIPYCACGGVMKPDVVFFGEMLPAGVLMKAQEEIARCDLLLVIGSSLVVAPASELPWLAIQAGSPLIICNLQDTWANRYAAAVLQEDVAVSLPTLLVGW